jgi:hypothetical protein
MFRLNVYRNNFHLFDKNRMNIVLNLYSLSIVTID